MKYKFRVGVEEEGFTLNRLGFIAPYSYIVAEDLLNRIQKNRRTLLKVRQILLGIQWEPDPSQIEYVTHPLELENLYKAIKYSRALLGECAYNHDLVMAFISMHPIQSMPLPINGTHINISYSGISEARRLGQLNYVANYLRNHIPEIIAATSNTPIYRGMYNGYVSNRLRLSKVLKKSEYSKLVIKPFRIIPPTMRERFRYGILFEKIRRYIRRIEVNKDGDRLLDLTVRGPYTNIIEDIFKSPETTRIEVRLIDNQLNIDYLNDIIAMLVGLIYEGLENYEKGRDLKKRENLNILRDKALKHGVDAVAEDGETLGEKIKEIMERIEPHISILGLKIRSRLRDGIPEVKINQPRVIDTNPDITELRIKGYHWMEIKTTGRRRLIKLDGEERIVPKGEYKGMIVPEYRIDFRENKGLLRKISKIHIKHYLYTGDGYLEIKSGDKILKHLKPLERLLEVSEKTILKQYTPKNQ